MMACPVTLLGGSADPGRRYGPWTVNIDLYDIRGAGGALEVPTRRLPNGSRIRMLTA